MVECLNCGKRRHQPEHECPRCSYVGWAFVDEIDDWISTHPDEWVRVFRLDQYS